LELWSNGDLYGDVLDEQVANGEVYALLKLPENGDL